MNSYKIEDLSVGMKESFTRAITAEMMQYFYEISGDENPLHRDAAFAREKGFPDRVVYGMLTASLISTLGGCYLPGRNCLIQGVEVKFAKPVFVGDELTVTGEVSRVETNLKYLEVKVVAEGVEYEEQFELLRDIGVDVIQGYYFSKPIPAECMEGFIKERVEHDNNRKA